jgi:hypothetical protein
MGQVIDIRKKRGRLLDDLITRTPWEFRWANWNVSHFVQMLKSQSSQLEKHREEVYASGGTRVWKIPSHFPLKGGLAHTIRVLWANRQSERKMREIYYLTGLMDCMINQVNPILRTDLLRDLYKKVFALKESLKVNWYGPLDQLLLPIHPHLYNESSYRSAIARAATMKDLYWIIEHETAEMFDILSHEYVFYCPGPGG